MTISYNWLCEYLPETLDPEKLSKILTAIGLEVESMEPYQSLKGGLEGLVTAEVLTCTKHPDADKLSITTVNIGAGEPLQIVCGAPNVAAGQKVIVATVGATIYPFSGEPMTMKKAKIRGVESHGMICAEDEIGLNDHHEGILILPNEVQPGIPAARYFDIYTDFIYEIGLTPNRMDAMSHLGVAKDVCAYLAHHNKKEAQVKSPFKNGFKPDAQGTSFTVTIENNTACRRYAGVHIQGVTIAESPVWLQQRLKSIGLRPINNIVDITNFILHETGQPLHAFDAATIEGQSIVVKHAVEGTTFKTLDEKDRTLSAEDLMICDAEKPMCLAGVYGGANSGVTAATTDLFLESAWFAPGIIRKTSFRHGLRTDAATRFEKGVDISNTVNVLKRAAILIKELAGGMIASDIIDVYPEPLPKTEVAIRYHYLKKLSGKNYHGDTIKNILSNLGFEILKEGQDDLRVAVPYSKPDISIAADLVEEIMRIDGLDNVEIPTTISMSPAIETLSFEASQQEKLSQYLAANGFHEIFTNSITNSAYYSEAVLQGTVKMINSLSADLNVMRPSLMETGLESVAYNLNRRNLHLRFFEFGKTYHTSGPGNYTEQQHLGLYFTGMKQADGWKSKGEKSDLFYAKAIVENLLLQLGISQYQVSATEHPSLQQAMLVKSKNEEVAVVGYVNAAVQQQFDLKQPVLFADLRWDKLLDHAKKQQIVFKGIPKFPAVDRDLSMVVNRSLAYENIEKATRKAKLGKLQSMRLFDVFESDKLGADKKSMAISFTFQDEEKTLTDAEIDGMMTSLIGVYEKELQAEIRK